MNPKLRFSEFGAELPWRKCLIGDILSILHGRDYRDLPEGDIPVLATGGQIASVAKPICTWPCVLIGRKGTINRPQFMNEPFWSVDTLYYSRPKKDQDPKFQYYLFQTIDWMKFNEASGVPSLSSSTIHGIEIFVPEIREQEKIASFFTLLDKKIALAEQNILKFSLVKDSLLKSVFHRNFLAANGDFRVEKFGDISSIKGGFGFPVSIQGQETKEIPFFKVSDMNGEGNEKELSIARNYITKETASNNKLKPFDNDGIVFAKVGAALLLERRRIARAPYLIDNNMMSVIPRDPENLEYLYYFLCSVRMANFSQSGALPSLNARHVSGIEVPIPSNEKIKSISNLFKEIDKKIILARKKKQTLDRMKQALLQKMFV